MIQPVMDAGHGIFSDGGNENEISLTGFVVGSRSKVEDEFMMGEDNTSLMAEGEDWQKT